MEHFVEGIACKLANQSTMLRVFLTAPSYQFAHDGKIAIHVSACIFVRHRAVGPDTMLHVVLLHTTNAVGLYGEQGGEEFVFVNDAGIETESQFLDMVMTDKQEPRHCPVCVVVEQGVHQLLANIDFVLFVDAGSLIAPHQVWSAFLTEYLTIEENEIIVVLLHL